MATNRRQFMCGAASIAVALSARDAGAVAAHPRWRVVAVRDSSLPASSPLEQAWLPRARTIVIDADPGHALFGSAASQWEHDDCVIVGWTFPPVLFCFEQALGGQGMRTALRVHGGDVTEAGQQLRAVWQSDATAPLPPMGAVPPDAGPVAWLMAPRRWFVART